MATSAPKPSAADRALKRLEAEHREQEEARRLGWTFLWILFAFKIATVSVIWYVAAGSGESLATIMVTTWYWVAIPVLAISGRVIFRWRMIQVRKRRDALRHAEFNVDCQIVFLSERDNGQLPESPAPGTP